MVAKWIFAVTVVSVGLTGIGLIAQGQSGNADKGNSSGKSDGKGNGNGQTNGQGNGDNGSQGNGNSQGQSGQARQNKLIHWLTDPSEVAAALADTGTAEVDFQSGVDLENIQVWLSPSLNGMTAEPLEFPDIAADMIYAITLTLDAPPEHTLGGTLHLRSGENSRTYAPPYPINVKVQGGQSDGSDDGEEPAAQVNAVVSSADYQGGFVTPGQIVTVFGEGLGPQRAQGPKLDTNGRLASYLGDTQVLFDGMPAPLLVSIENQVNAVVPQGVAGQTSVEVVVTHEGSVSNTVTVSVEPVAPALFTLNGSGSGQSAALNEDGTINGHQHPAPRGSVVSFFGSGLGEWSQPVPDGTIIDATPPAPKASVTVTIGGLPANVLYVGGAPGTVSGVAQLNVEVPPATPPGDAEVEITAGGKSSPASVTVVVH